jgi:flagellar operon protein
MDFRGVLAEQLGAGQIKFSAHAQARIGARQIQLGGNDLAKLKGAVDRAAAKGARESLILMDDKAFVVSVRNRTVITAVDGESIRENVFTNIDSAVIV